MKEEQITRILTEMVRSALIVTAPQHAEYLNAMAARRRASLARLKDPEDAELREKHEEEYRSICAEIGMLAERWTSAAMETARPAAETIIERDGPDTARVRRHRVERREQTFSIGGELEELHRWLSCLNCGLRQDNLDGYLKFWNCDPPLAVTNGHTLERNEDQDLECTGCRDNGGKIEKFSTSGLRR